MDKEKITALYCRISREDDLHSVSSSIETQKIFLKRYANQHRMLNTKFYIDDGYTGTNFNRPGFGELQSDIENNRVDVVITKDLSRLGRDYLSTGYYIEHYFPTNDVRYIAINDQVDTLLNDNDFAPFRNIMNEWYARDISKKIRSAYRTKAMNGDFTGPFPPYGYDKKQGNRNQLVVNPSKAEVVKRIFDSYLSGISVYGISKGLKTDRIMTPRAELSQRLGKYHSETTDRYPYNWSIKTILNILENSEYTGNVVSNRYQTASYKNKKLIPNPVQKWIVSQHKHQAIIDESTFRLVQDKIHLSTKLPKTPHENFFKGLIRCKDCGKTLTLSIRSGRKSQRTYDCSTYRRYGKSRCSSHYVNYEQVEHAVLDRMNQLITLSKIGKDAVECVSSHLGDFVDRLEKISQDIRNQEDRIVEISQITKSLYECFVLGKIQEEKFLVLDKGYDEERMTLLRNIKALQENYEEQKKKQTGVASLCGFLSEFEIQTSLNHQILHDLIERVVVHKEKEPDNFRKIEIHFKFLGKL